LVFDEKCENRQTLRFIDELWWNVEIWLVSVGQYG